MKAKRILDVLGYVDDAYIEEMLEEAPAIPRRKTLKRVWLIAAIVAVMVFLMGCAVVAMVKMRVSDIEKAVEYGQTLLNGTEEYKETVVGEAIHFEEVHDVFIELGAYYPQVIPEGYAMTFVSEGAPLSSQHIDYENGEGKHIYYRIYIGSEASNVEVYNIVSKTEVNINGQDGILYEQEQNCRTLVWVNEMQGYGFALRTDDANVDLLAMAKSTAEGEDLTPTRSESTVKALEELGDYSPTCLPEGYTEQGVLGSPISEGGGWYAYVRKYYVNKAENASIYFEYETYAIDTEAGYEDNAKTVCSFYIPQYGAPEGEILGEEIEINGMFGLADETDIAWADPESHVVYHLHSKNVTGDDLVQVAQSICENP